MNIVIRELHEPQEIAEIPQLEQAIWNDPSETIRSGTLMALVHEGALLAGAYLDESSATSLSQQGERGAGGPPLVGFVFGFPTNRPTEHHSHMAGVLPGYQSSRIGLALKHYQRDWALSRGYERVVWTFDPLRGLNAHFNLRKLGATFNRYIPNCYGVMSGINAGSPSDRAYATWDLRSQRVFSRIYAPPPVVAVEGLPQANHLENQAPIKLDLGLSERQILVQIPEDWGQILQADTNLANEWRVHCRALFEHYFAQGYHAVDFVRGPNRYVLERLGV
ncbi:GNAT family N-acetyltransferase [uncultured Meiothermus sp.]|jgi:predicted GNAT superfamily acetyltransferase|uniref:GNAT family N-acetyltransferase n=1 Tax=uncultured Meiothermus sp. TaxID=157471 RepID=UPI0026371866|nr:GNAT family N-acetyltransferase [uncultured Meiothermus sp.]